MLRDGKPTRDAFMTRYLEIVLRSKLRLLVLIVLLPLVLSALDIYLWRSYEATEVVWVPDATGQGVGYYLGYSPYQSPSQNAARLFSNLLGTQSFNNAIADQLLAEGVIHSDRDRAILIASLSQLTVTPGGAVSSGSSGSSSSGGSGGASPGDHTMTIRFVCSKEAVCLAALPVALDVFKTQYQDLKGRAAASLRAIYEANLTTAQAENAAAIAAIQKYEASHPAPKHADVQSTDPALTALQHDLDQAQKDVDNAQAQLQGLDTLVQLGNGAIANMYAVDAPKIQKGLYGIKGFRTDNLKTDAVVLAACVAAAAVYLILVAFLDRGVRDPNEIKNKLGKPVVVVPAFQSRARSRSLRKKNA
jgi:hypothetical protein